MAAILLLGTTAFAAEASPHKKSPVVANLENNVKCSTPLNDTANRKKVEFSALPANIQYAIKNQYANFEPVNPVVVLQAEGMSSYYLSVENDHKTIDLSCSSDGEIVVLGSRKKSRQ